MTTNKQFIAHKGFIDACCNAGIPTTTRQASKFQMQKGLAFKVSTGKAKVLKNSDGKFIKITNQIL